MSRLQAHTEVRYSTNVTAYGSKSENNYVVLWIRDSDLVRQLRSFFWDHFCVFFQLPTNVV